MRHESGNYRLILGKLLSLHRRRVQPFKISGISRSAETVSYTHLDPVDISDTSTVEVEIPRGSSLNTISEILYENDLIRNTQVFKLYVDFSDMSSKLKAGTYELSRSMTFDDIIYTLQEGNAAQAALDVRFIEGRTAEAVSYTHLDVYKRQLYGSRCGGRF